MLTAATLILPRAGAAMAAVLAGLVDRVGTLHADSASSIALLAAAIGLAVGAFLLPVVGVLFLAGLGASLAQSPLRLSPQRLAPDLSRLSLRQGMQRLMGARGAVEFAKSLMKVIGLGAIATFVLASDAPRLIAALRYDPATLPSEALAIAAHLLGATALAMALVATLDLVWTRRHWRNDLRMTHHEVKEEHKQSEGDPLVKARLRSIALDRARRRMMTNVPRATMVVTNPTHFAIALRYVRSEGGAKGQDLLAIRIREIAREAGIPLIENKPLARALYDPVEVDRMIPPDFYRAVAEIINTLDRRRSAFGP